VRFFEEMTGSCKCLIVPTTSFKKNGIYMYKKYYGIHNEYVSFFVGSEFIQNLPMKHFENHFIDLQEERDIKLDQILE